MFRIPVRRSSYLVEWKTYNPRGKTGFRSNRQIRFARFFSPLVAVQIRCKMYIIRTRACKNEYRARQEFPFNASLPIWNFEAFSHSIRFSRISKNLIVKLHKSQIIHILTEISRETRIRLRDRRWVKGVNDLIINCANTRRWTRFAVFEFCAADRNRAMSRVSIFRRVCKHPRRQITKPNARTL